MFFRRCCPNKLCDWSAAAWTPRAAQLLLDEHLAICPNWRPMPVSLDGPLEQTWSQIIRCRYVPYGCTWFRKFGPGRGRFAEVLRTLHQWRCEHRHRRT